MFNWEAKDEKERLGSERLNRTEFPLVIDYLEQLFKDSTVLLSRP
ncbi:hypothetical protein ABIE12_001910 [Serratia sp. 509]